MKKKLKSSLSSILLILVMVIGLSLMLYPSFSNWWNSLHQSKVINTYMEELSHIELEQYDEIWKSAILHNETLRANEEKFLLPSEMQDSYYQQLNISENGMIGSIEIPSIGCTLPIYHGTSDVVLQVAVGHLEWSSLPTGGESTHCVLSGHRGLPSARLFTDLDQLREGDTFILHILDEILTYEVDQILIVLPHETDALLIEEGKDLCTLVTCTPYGVNSHRMLVRGHRVENAAQTVNRRVTADALRVEPFAVAAVLFFPILILLLILTSVMERLFKTTRKNISGR